MGDWRYVGLSMVISFIGPFYMLEEKIYQFNEAERIARETCISFNQEFGITYIHIAYTHTYSPVYNADSASSGFFAKSSSKYMDPK